MEKINVAELLRYCPSGMELDCTNFNGTWSWSGELNGIVSQGYCTQENICNKYKLTCVGKMNYMPACKHFDEKERTSFIISGGEKEYLDFKKYLEQENITIE